MFIGHYAPAAAIKSVAPKVPLWHLFVAVQFLDYLWAGFILAGIEHARVAPGFLAASHLDLYDMPYTHSLAGAALWSVLAGVAYGGLLNRRAGAAGGRAWLWFHSNVGTATDATIDVESDDNSGFTSATSRGTFTFSTSGVHHLELSLATVERYLRINTTDLGGATSVNVTVVAGVSGITY